MIHEASYSNKVIQVQSCITLYYTGINLPRVVGNERHFGHFANTQAGIDEFGVFVSHLK